MQILLKLHFTCESYEIRIHRKNTEMFVIVRKVEMTDIKLENADVEQG